MCYEPESIEGIDWCYDIGKTRMFGCGEVAGVATVVIEGVDTYQRGDRQPHKWQHGEGNSLKLRISWNSRRLYPRCAK